MATPAANLGLTQAGDLRTHLDLILGEQVMIVAKETVAAVNHSEDYPAYTALLTANANDLTALMRRPDRLIYVSSSENFNGAGPLRDIDWLKRRWDPARAYAESKLYVVALAFAIARRWPAILSNAVDPGWARTRMGGALAPVSLDAGQRTQSWLPVSKEPAAMVSGFYWNNLRHQQPASETTNIRFQDQLIAEFRNLTDVALD